MEPVTLWRHNTGEYPRGKAPMKAVILAGGFGTRISEESAVKPKPMVEIGGRPILWHIMKMYEHHGIDDFIVCCGYRGEQIKEWFAHYSLVTSDVSFNLADGSVDIIRRPPERWRVTLVDTGLNTMTGGRVNRVADYVSDGTFCLTYGDGVSDVDLSATVAFHHERNAVVTLTAVQRPGRFGALALQPDESKVDRFHEKPVGDDQHQTAYVNGGFFVVEPAALQFIDGDDTVWEEGPLERLAMAGQLHAYRHDGFWHPMDTLRDKHVLEEMWADGTAPWCRWAT